MLHTQDLEGALIEDGFRLLCRFLPNALRFAMECLSL